MESKHCWSEGADGSDQGVMRVPFLGAVAMTTASLNQQNHKEHHKLYSLTESLSLLFSFTYAVTALVVGIGHIWWDFSQKEQLVASSLMRSLKPHPGKTLPLLCLICGRELRRDLVFTRSNCHFRPSTSETAGPYSLLHPFFLFCLFQS